MSDDQRHAAPALSVEQVAITHADRGQASPADATFEVSPGEVVLLLGPSGCGKSSLALAVNGLIPHAVPARVDGRIVTAGRDVAATDVAELSRYVGMVFQDPDAQVVTGTVLDEVCFGPENLLVEVDEVLERAETALRQVGLWHRRHDNPDVLSGGGRQRLAIACALALESRLLVLDEPTANLDPSGTAEVYAVLNTLVRRPADQRPAIVLVEHNVDAAIDIIDRVVVLDQAGRVVASGPARSTLRDRAADLADLGVWLPIPLLAALRLRKAGITLDPLPLTGDEFTAALDRVPDLPAPNGDAALDAPNDSTSTEPRTEVPSSADPDQPEVSPLLEARGLSVARSEASIVSDVDLDVRAGEFLAVVGANGAGKTTLVQALAGVIPAAGGTARIDGLDPARIGAAKRARTVGFVFQNPEAQFIAPSVFDELAHGLRMPGVRRAERLTDDEITARVHSLMDRLGLTGLDDVHPFLLSGGQKRRLSVGTVLITHPSLIALDEPTFGQDHDRAAALLALLDQLQREGTTIIVVTHDLQLVAEHADRVAVMADGRLTDVGPPSRILADTRLLQRARLRVPTLARALGNVSAHPEWNALTRMADLPGGAP